MRMPFLLTGQSSESSLDFGEEEHQRKKEAPYNGAGDRNESVEHRLSGEVDSRKFGMK